MKEGASLLIGLLLVTHGNLGSALLDSTEIIAGKVKQAGAVGLFHGDSPEQFRGKIEKEIELLDTGDGIIVMVDIIGGTPGNEAMKMTSDHKLKILSGVNLAMVLEFTLNREFVNNVNDVAKTSMESANLSIKDLSLICEQIRKGAD